MSVSQAQRDIDSEEFTYWKAKYSREGGLGDAKADRAWAWVLHLLALSAGNGKSDYDDWLQTLNPSYVKSDMDIGAKVKHVFSTLALIPNGNGVGIGGG